MGVSSGTLFEIISRDEKRIVRNREITIPGQSVGFIKIEDVSMDASKGKVLRKWGKIEPGFQAHEIANGIFTKAAVNKEEPSNSVRSIKKLVKNL